MDAIDFLRKKHCVPPDKSIVDVFGTRMFLDYVFRDMEEYGNLREEQISSKVLAWLGYHRDKIDPGAVSQLQDILLKTK